MDKKEKEKRDARNKSEKKRRHQFNVFFTELRAVLHSHGYPVKTDKSTTLQNTIDFLQKKEVKVSPEASPDKPNWNLTFQKYEDFIQTALQSLDGFLIILSTDGMIVYAAENIFTLLGHLPFEVIGKKLLSFLPDEEKEEVHKKITLELPVSDPEGNHIEFCCHFKRGDIECAGTPAYEYVKFIMTVNDIFHGPFTLFGGFSSNCAGSQSSVTNLSALPLEEQFYLMGTVCFLRSDRLQEWCTLKEVNEETSSRQNLDEERHLADFRSTQGERRASGTESTSADPADGTLNAPTDSVETEQCGPCGNIDDANTEHESSYATSMSPQAAVPDLPTTSSSMCSGVKFKVDQKGQVVQDILPSSSVAANTTVQSSMASYVNYHEMQLMHKFKKQLEKKTWSLQAHIRSQQEALEVLKERLQTVQEAKFQMQADGPQPQVLGPEPQKPPGKRTQLNLKEEQQQEEPKLQEEPLALTKEPSPQEPQQPPVATGSQGLHLCLPTHTDVAVPFYSKPVQLLQPQPIVVPVQIVDEVGAEQQPSVYYQDENHGHRGDEHHSFLPEEQPGSSVDPKSQAQSRAHSPGLKAHSSAGFAQSPVSTLETPQDYIQLWQQPPDPQHHLFFQVDTWPAREQTSLCGQAIWHQIQAPKAAAQARPGPEAFQVSAEHQPDQLTYFLPAEQSDLDQQRHFRRQL